MYIPFSPEYTDCQALEYTVKSPPVSRELRHRVKDMPSIWWTRVNWVKSVQQRSVLEEYDQGKKLNSGIALTVGGAVIGTRGSGIAGYSKELEVPEGEGDRKGMGDGGGDGGGDS